MVLSLNKAHANHPVQKLAHDFISQHEIQGDSIKLTGQIVDSYTKEPIPYCTVHIRDSRIGVVADEHGNFELIIKRDQLSEDDRLICSFVGYFSQSIRLSELEDQNFLVELEFNAESALIGEIHLQKEPLFRRIFRRKNGISK